MSYPYDLDILMGSEQSCAECGGSHMENSQPSETYTVTLPTDDHGTIEPTGDSHSPVEKGGSFSFTVTPDSDYHITSVKSNGDDLTSSESVYTISNIQEDQVVTVVIEAD